MNVILSLKHKKGTNETLDYIAVVEFETQDDIAKGFGISIKALEKRIAKLKKDGLLVVYRYTDNNFIYMVGDDAKSNWNKHEAIEIAKYRKYPDILQSGLSDEEAKEVASDLPLFDLKDERMYKNDAGKDFKPKYPESMRFSDADREEIDKAVADILSNYNG